MLSWNYKKKLKMKLLLLFSHIANQFWMHLSILNVLILTEMIFCACFSYPCSNWIFKNSGKMWYNWVNKLTKWFQNKLAREFSLNLCINESLLLLWLKDCGAKIHPSELGKDWIMKYEKLIYLIINKCWQ